MNGLWELLSCEAIVAEPRSSMCMTSWLALWISSLRWRSEASASSIFCLHDFSLTFARHNSSSFCLIWSWSCSSLSLCSSTSLSFWFEVLGSIGPCFIWLRPCSSSVRGRPSFSLGIVFFHVLPIVCLWSWGE
jgi:hypothetical protein